MLRISDDLLSRYTSRFVGTERPVLLEHPRPGHTMSGFTDNYLKVTVDAPASLDNHIVNVRLDGINPEQPEELLGTLMS